MILGMSTHLFTQTHVAISLIAIVSGLIVALGMIAAKPLPASIILSLDLRNVPPETGSANLLVLPNIDAANISYNLLRMAAGSGITVGGILLGADRAVHILTPSATVRTRSSSSGP